MYGKFDLVYWPLKSKVIINSYFYEIKNEKAGRTIELFCVNISDENKSLLNSMMEYNYLYENHDIEDENADVFENLSNYIFEKLEALGFIEQILTNPLSDYSNDYGISEPSFIDHYNDYIEGADHKIHFIYCVGQYIHLVFDFLLRKEHPDLTLEEAKPFYFDFEADL